MAQPSKDIVDFNFYNIEEEQFLRILARVTTSIVSIYFKQHFTIQDIHNHVNFEDGDPTNLHVQTLILAH